MWSLISVSHSDHRDEGVHNDAGRVYERRENLLVPLLRRLDEDSQRSARRQHGEQVPQRDGAQHDPRGPVRQVLDEDEGHEGGDEYEVGLLHYEGPLPVDADHAHDTKVPEDDAQGDPVHGQVVCLQHDADVDEGEEEEQEQGGQEKPAVDESVAAVLEGQHQEGGHHGDHAQHDGGVGKGVPGNGARIVALQEGFQS